MAEQQNESDEKTEEATPRKREQAREEGEVPRSRDLGTSALLLAGAVTMLMLGGWVAEQLAALARASFSFDRQVLEHPGAMIDELSDALVHTLWFAVPILVVPMLAGIVSSVALGGVIFSTKSFMPKGSRLNPISGLGRMFSMRALIELCKSILKFGVVSAPVGILLWYLADDLLVLQNKAVPTAIADAISMIGWAFLGMCCATLIVAAFDVPLQIFQYEKKLRMSHQDIKDELKNTEGRPEVKARLRRVAQEMAQRRMLTDVPKADVIITNPDHYAVALRYDATTMAAPKLLAKGADLMAARIRAIAAEHGIPMVSAPALARATYYSTEIGYEIPKGLYVAVAQILAYVHQLRRYRGGQGTAPVLPTDLPIPDELRRDR